MKRNEHGKIVGDKFHFTREGLKQLANWFGNDSRSVFDDRTARTKLGSGTIDNLREALYDLAKRYP